MADKLCTEREDELRMENEFLRERLAELFAENEALKEPVERSPRRNKTPLMGRVTSMWEASHGVTSSSLVAWADPLEKEVSGEPCCRKKIVYLVRHAEAAHNVFENQLKTEAKAAGKDEKAQKEAAKAALPDERFRDARLSSQGCRQVQNSEKNFEQLLKETHYLMPETVLVSPLRRTLMTAAVLFPEHEDVRAVEIVRERRTGFPCDERLSAAVTKVSFPSVNFNEVLALDAKCDDGYAFREELKESYTDVARRGDRLLPYLETLESDVIAIVSHKGFMRELMQDSWKSTLSCPENLKMEMSNAEVRVCEITWCDIGRVQSIVMKSLKTATCEPTVNVKFSAKPSDRVQRYICEQAQNKSSLSVAVATSSADNVEEAINEVWQQLREKLGGLPTVALVYGQSSVNPAQVVEKLNELQPSLSVIGGSSMSGVVTSHARAPFGIMGFRGWAKRCGIGYGKGSEITDAFSAQEAGEKAMRDAGQGSMPDIVIMCVSSGYEEHILVGINKVCKGVRIFGGSCSNDAFISRDNNPSWQLYGGLAGWGALDDGGFVLLAIWSHEHNFMHTVLSHCFGSTEDTGLITRAEGREIFEIDNRPAADVFTEWTGLSHPYSVKDLAQYALSFNKDDMDNLVHIKPSDEEEKSLHCYASTACDLGCVSARLVRIKPSAFAGSIKEVLRKAREAANFEVRGLLVMFGACTSTLLTENDWATVRNLLGETAPEVIMLLCLGGQGKGSAATDSFHGNKMFNFLFFG